MERLAGAFGADVVLSGEGDEGSLRKAATDDGIPTVTVEMGKAHRFQPALIDRAAAGVESVLAEYGVLCDASPTRPAWTRVIRGAEQRRWIRDDAGGLVEMRWGPSPPVYEDETICTVTDHFERESHVVAAPFTGLVVGVLENPVALPGHPFRPSPGPLRPGGRRHRRGDSRRDGPRGVRRPPAGGGPVPRGRRGGGVTDDRDRTNVRIRGDFHGCGRKSSA